MPDNNIQASSGNVYDEELLVRNIVDLGQPMIDMVHEQIHRKNYFDFTHVFAAILDDGFVRLSIRPQTKEAHLIVTVSAEGKALFKSYVDTTWSADGTAGSTFNRYINDSPDADTLIYYGGTMDVVGTMRFDTLVLGGLGPQSTGATSGSRVESVLDSGHELTIEIQNVSGQSKDIGVVIEWYELEE